MSQPIVSDPISQAPAPLPVVLPPEAELLTVEEFVRRYGSQAVELIKGHVVEMPMTFPRHGSICAEVAFLLTSHVRTNNLGHIVINDAWIKIQEIPATVRGPDICFFSYDRLPKGPVPEGLLSVVPELVVEVRSPSDRWIDVFAKVVDYLKAGVGVVVVIDAVSRTASLYRPEVQQEVLEADQELTIPDVLPGFSVLVGRLFE